MGTLFVDKLDPQSGTSLELGSSGDTVSVNTGATTNLLGNVTLGASGKTITVPAGATITNNGTQTGFGVANTPAFEAYMGADVNVTDNAQTKVQCQNEVFDTANAYDNSTNYRFTPQTAGKYFVYGAVTSITDSSSLKEGRGMIYLNGSRYKTASTDFRNNFGYRSSNFVSAIIDMNGSSDYVELYGLTNKEGGTYNQFTSGFEKSTYFGAFKIIE